MRGPGGTRGQRSSGLTWVHLIFFAAAALVVIGVAALVIPYTERARDQTRAEQFQQFIGDLEHRQLSRLSLEPDFNSSRQRGGV